MEEFFLMSVIAILILLFASYKPNGNFRKDNKIDLPPSSKQDIAVNNNSTVTFEGTSSKTKRIYIIDIQFYPNQEKCILTFENTPYELKRYQIGSEYEYKNDRVTLRVRGSKAILVLPEGWIVQLKPILSS